MKSVLIYTTGLLLCLLLLGCMPMAGEEEIYQDVIRLHVLANSDREEDQQLKLTVRDAILASYSEQLAGGTTAEAEEQLLSLLPQIEKTAEKVLADHGRPTSVRVTYTQEQYPERVYGELHFPAGTYRSLRVLIGEGAGQNWWCVLFPPLCVGAATDDLPITSPGQAPDGVNDNAWRLVSQSGEYQIRFRILEWLMG